MLHEARAMISRRMGKRVLAVVGALLLLSAPACLESSTDPTGSDLNPQPLPPRDPEDKNGVPVAAPGGGSSSGGGMDTGATNADGGTDGDVPDGQAD
jgi:hypothetical protein